VALKSARAKGKNGELEACHILRDLFGWMARRSQQFSGWSRDGDSPDIVCDHTPGLFFEVKRVERLNIPRALLTAVKQCGRKCPVVLHRQNRSPVGWMLTIRLEDLPRLAHAYSVACDSESKAGTTVAAKELPGSNAHDSQSGGEATGHLRRMSNR
jgi:hypothetical protein